MATEVTRRGEFSQFVTNHIFSYQDRNEGFAVVYCDGFADHVGNDHRGAAPRFDHLFPVALLGLGYFFQQRVVDVRAFFK